jgi:hypothetical protein
MRSALVLLMALGAACAAAQEGEGAGAAPVQATELDAVWTAQAQGVPGAVFFSSFSAADSVDGNRIGSVRAVGARRGVEGA